MSEPSWNDFGWYYDDGSEEEEFDYEYPDEPESEADLGDPNSAEDDD